MFINEKYKYKSNLKTVYYADILNIIYSNHGRDGELIVNKHSFSRVEISAEGFNEDFSLSA